jgi:ribosomal silencing factor RsfS
MLRLGHSLGRGASLQCRRLPANQFSACWFSSDSDKEDDKATKNNDESVTAEWIPPSRPLHGDQDLSQLIRSQKELDRAEEYLFKVDENDTEEETLRRLEEALALEERLEKEGEKELLANERYQQEPVDWLQTRRQALSANDKDEPQVPVIHHQRLTESEITSLLESFGGNDITILKDDKEYPRMGGATAMIICTASNVFYVNSITKNLVEHLKERQLQDLGVLGAQMGKTFSQPTSRNNWNVVDCQNYIVHVFDQPTREVLNLEQLWSGKVGSPFVLLCANVPLR